MIKLFTLCLKAMFFTYITAAGFLYFGPIGLIPIGLWVWSYQLERRDV